MTPEQFAKLKLALRISHDKLDEDIRADYDACQADLKMHGIIYAPENDPLIYNAVKLYCKSLYTDDPTKAAAFLQRYEALRDSLKMAEGYGWKDDSEEADADE